MRQSYFKPNNLEEHTEYSDWEAVFAHPMPIRIETLNTGIIASKISGMINLKNKDAAGLKEGTARIPVVAHLVRHEKYGDYLIDTGFDSSFSNCTGGNFKGIYKKRYFNRRYFQEKASDGIENQLKEKSVSLKGVFLTHFHEHVSGAPSLPDEIPYVFGDGEHEECYFPLVYSNFFKNKPNLQRFDFTAGQELPVFGDCINVFGDGSFWALSTPGHTKGHVSYVVNGVGKQALITGDCSISKKGFELGIESGNHSADLTEGRRSFLKLKEFADRYPFLKVLFGHETDEFQIDY